MTPCQQGSLTLSRATSFPCLFSLHLRVAVDCDTLSDPTRSTDSVQAPFYQCKQPLEQQNKWYALQASQHTPGRPGIPSGPWRWPSAACPPFASGAWPGPAPCRAVQLLGSHVPRLMKRAAWRMRVRSWMPPFPPLTHGFAPHESPRGEAFPGGSSRRGWSSTGRSLLQVFGPRSTCFHKTMAKSTALVSMTMHFASQPHPTKTAGLEITGKTLPVRETTWESWQIRVLKCCYSADEMSASGLARAAACGDVCCASSPLSTDPKCFPAGNIHEQPCWLPECRAFPRGHHSISPWVALLWATIPIVTCSLLGISYRFNARFITYPRKYNPNKMKTTNYKTKYLFHQPWNFLAPNDNKIDSIYLKTIV